MIHLNDGLEFYNKLCRIETVSILFFRNFIFYVNNYITCLQNIENVSSLKMKYFDLEFFLLMI